MNDPVSEPIVVGVKPKRDRVTKVCTVCEKRYHQKRGFKQEDKCKTCALSEDECLECIEQWGLCPACRREITGDPEPRKSEKQTEKEYVSKQVVVPPPAFKPIIATVVAAVSTAQRQLDKPKVTKPPAFVGTNLDQKYISQNPYEMENP